MGIRWCTGGGAEGDVEGRRACIRALVPKFAMFVDGCVLKGGGGKREGKSVQTRDRSQGSGCWHICFGAK